MATPSSNRADMSSSLHFEPFERIRPAEDHELVAAADDDVRFRVEFHPQIAPLDADDDDAEALTKIGIENRPVREARRLAHGDLFHRELKTIRARRELEEVDDRGPQRSLRDLQSANLVRRDDAARTRALQLRRRVVGFRASDDEQIRTHHARRQYRVNIFGVGAYGGDEATSPLDADARQNLFPARVRLDGERAVLQRFLDGVGTAIDHDEWHGLL